MLCNWEEHMPVTVKSLWITLSIFLPRWSTRKSFTVLEMLDWRTSGDFLWNALAISEVRYTAKFLSPESSVAPRGAGPTGLAGGGDIWYLSEINSEHRVQGFYRNKQSFLLVLYLATWQIIPMRGIFQLPCNQAKQQQLLNSCNCHTQTGDVTTIWKWKKWLLKRTVNDNFLKTIAHF